MFNDCLINFRINKDFKMPEKFGFHYKLVHAAKTKEYEYINLCVLYNFEASLIVRVTKDGTERKLQIIFMRAENGIEHVIQEMDYNRTQFIGDMFIHYDAETQKVQIEHDNVLSNEFNMILKEDNQFVIFKNEHFLKDKLYMDNNIYECEDVSEVENIGGEVVCD